MNVISAIIQILSAIPKVIELIKMIYDLIREGQNKAKREDQVQAIDTLKKAQTVEELKRANKEITKNLP